MAKNSIIKNKYIIGLLIVLFWLLAWQAASLAIGNTLILPSPLITLQTLFQLVLEISFWKTVALTLLRITLGFISAVLCGAAFAILTAKSLLCKKIFSPILHIVKATPVASFIIITLIWLPKNTIPVFISFLMVLPIIWANVEKGILNINHEFLEMATSFRLSKSSVIKKILIPSVMPYFMAGAVTAMGMAWKAGVAAEVLCTPKFAIGSRLHDSQVYLEIPNLFAWTATVIILSIILEKLFVRIMKKYGKRYNVSEVK